MWIEFLRDYDWYPQQFKKSRHSFVRYKKGKVIFVTRDCAEETLAAGAARKTAKPKGPKWQRGLEASNGLSGD